MQYNRTTTAGSNMDKFHKHNDEDAKKKSDAKATNYMIPYI